MKRYLLDSGPAQDFLFRRRGVHERVVEARENGSRIGMALPVLGEVYGGMELSSSSRESLKIVSQKLNQLVLWPFDKAAAREYGRIYAHLRRTGQVIQQVDMQIAAIALSLGNCTIVTYDSDFAAIPGLNLVDWRS